MVIQLTGFVIIDSGDKHESINRCANEDGKVKIIDMASLKHRTPSMVYLQISSPRL